MPKKNRNKKTYDIDPRLSEVIEDIAIEYGVPRSQVAAYFIALGAAEFFDKKINIIARLKRSNSPAYQNEIDMEDIIERVRRALD